jgi:hypothetical protein
MSTIQLDPISTSGIVNKSQAKRSEVIRSDSEYILEFNPIAVIPSELTASAKCADDKSNLISVPSSARIMRTSASLSNSMHTRIMRGLRTSMYFSDTRISKEAFAQLRKSFRRSLSSSELIFLHTVCEQGPQASNLSSGHISLAISAAIAGVTRSAECTRQKLYCVSMYSSHPLD